MRGVQLLRDGGVLKEMLPSVPVVILEEQICEFLLPTCIKGGGVHRLYMIYGRVKGLESILDEGADRDR
jgi:hypothetical protein